MARQPKTTTSLRLVNPEAPNPFTKAMTVDLPQAQDNNSEVKNGVRQTKNSDGSMTFDFRPGSSNPLQTGFNENLADELDDTELSRIAAELLTDIETDDRSRKEWLDTRAEGIKLLALKIEEPRGDVGTSSAPLEGMATIRHPLLLEAVLRFQANARGELLPAAGPVKVRNDAPVAPEVLGTPQLGQPNFNPGQPQPDQSPGYSPEQPGEVKQEDDLADALETDLNHYLTSTAHEYYPDTDRMLFYVGFGGQGFKKVYHCPIRQRPVSESVDAEDLIVSNAATSLEDCGRITQRIMMRPSTLTRMQILGAYRDVVLPLPPQYPTSDPVKKEKEATQGVKPQAARPEDAEYELYECYCELKIQGDEHKIKGKETGLRSPYRVTLVKDSREILEIRRNWHEDDKLRMPKQYFVEFPFVRGLGFYAIGLLHIVGNTTKTLTAAWREMLDAGMFSSFPGFIYDKMAGRQLTNQFRVSPGGGIPIQVGPGRRIQDAVMPLPYKEAGAGFTQFIAAVEATGQRVAGTAEIKIGEGTQDIPVGTTLAVIEQATKVMDAVHKRLHASQAQEFALIKERFKEDPEAFWRHNRKTTVKWKKDQFIKALNNADLVPVADPNNPTSLHRIAKAVAIKTLQQSAPMIYDPVAVDRRIMRIVGIDPEGLFQKNPQMQPPDPRLIDAQTKAQSAQIANQIKQVELQLKTAQAHAQVQQDQNDAASRERIEQMKIQLEGLRIQQERIIHAKDLQADQVQAAHEQHADVMARGGEVIAEGHRTQMEMQRDHAEHLDKMEFEKLKHGQQLEHEREKHRLELEAEKEKHRNELEAKERMHAEQLKVDEKVGMEAAKHQPAPAGGKSKVAKKPKK